MIGAMRTILLSFCLLLAACGGVRDSRPGPGSASGALLQNASSSPLPLGTHVRREFPSKTHYLAIDEKELPDIAKSSILFFAKAGDPFTKDYDALLKKLALSGTLVTSVYRLEFGSSTGARFHYGTVTGNTFLVLGPGRERIRSLVHPTLRELLFLVTETVSP